MVRIKVVKASQIIMTAILVIVVISAVIIGLLALSRPSAVAPTNKPNISPPAETLPPAGTSITANPDLFVAIPAAALARVSRALREGYVDSPWEEDKPDYDQSDEPEIMLTLLEHDYENEQIIDIEIIHEIEDSPTEIAQIADISTKSAQTAEITTETAQTAEILTEAVQTAEVPTETMQTDDVPTEMSEIAEDIAGTTPSAMAQTASAPDKSEHPTVDASPEILIYHTHSREAYEQNTEKPQYVEAGHWRTADSRFSVLRVGDELKKELESVGISVIHDVTDHEPPQHGTSYTRSLATLESYYENEKSLKVFIDLHRDGYVEGQKGANTVTANGVEAAKLMFLVGNGEGSTGSGGFAIKPDWEENYKLASALTEAINTQVPGLCRPVMISTGRYNQHVSTSCLLVEVGNNKNTLDEALASIPYLAEAIREVVGTM